MKRCLNPSPALQPFMVELSTKILLSDEQESSINRLETLNTGTTQSAAEMETAGDAVVLLRMSHNFKLGTTYFWDFPRNIFRPCLVMDNRNCRK